MFGIHIDGRFGEVYSMKLILGVCYGVCGVLLRHLDWTDNIKNSVRDIKKAIFIV